MTALHFDKKDIAKSFSQAASAYDQHSFIQKEIGARLLEKVAILKKPPKTILDAGAGTGFLTRKIQQKFPHSTIIGLDLAQGMILCAKNNQPWQPWKNKPFYVRADTEVLPFAHASIDLIISNFTLQWCANLSQVFNEFKRVLKPTGMLFFSTLGPNTLQELRLSWQAVPDQCTHVNEFIDMHEVGDGLLQAHFSDPVIDMELITITYAQVHDLLHDLKATGAHNINMHRPKGCLPKSYFKKMLLAYEHFKQPDGLYPATFEIIYGHAWQSDLKWHHQDQDGIIRIPGAHIPVLQCS